MEKQHDSFFLDWNETFQAGAGVSGGKGWNLARLVRYGFHVPAGGVLSLDAYDEFLRENGLEELVEAASAQISLENMEEKDTQEALVSLRQRIIGGTIPERVRQPLKAGLRSLGLLHVPVAVRSSAAAEDSPGASFAGVHESFLNVSGFEDILSAVKDCYASLWTSRAVSYRRRMRIADSLVASAVVIMEMVKTVAAGIGFTCNPHSGRQDDLVIDAGYGLGEAIVAGLIEPDEYHLAPKPALIEIRTKRIGAKEGMSVAKKSGGTEFVSMAHGRQTDQVLPDEWIVKLGAILLRIFDTLGQGDEHQDVEWAFDGNDFFIVQARPVTALPRYTYRALKDQPDIWSNGNLRDAIPMVLSTLGWGAVKILTEHMLRTPLRAVGYPLLPGLQYIRRYQGRSYLNVALQQWEYFDAFGVTPSETNELTGGHQPEIDLRSAESVAGSNRLMREYRKWRLFLAIKKAQKHAHLRFAEHRNRVNQWLKKDYRSLSNKQILDIFHEMDESAMELVSMVMLLNSAAGFPLRRLANILERAFPGKGNSMSNALLIGRANITSAEHGDRLIEMAKTARNDPDARAFFSSEPFDPKGWKEALPETSAFKQKFRSFLDDFGHRGVYEADIANPRWREDPSYPLEVVRSLTGSADLQKMRGRRKAAGDRAWREVEAGTPYLWRLLVKWWVRKAVEGAELRELGKSEMVRTGETLRLILHEIGRRLAETGVLDCPADVYYSSWSELSALFTGNWDGKGLKVLVAERRERQKELERLSPPDLIVEERPHYAGGGPSLGGKILVGLGVAAGRASGRARLIRHPSEGGKLNPGEVLVAPSTDPAWTPLFLKASAVVMETGGFLSHGAIVAREYGVPAVVNIPGVMEKLKDGCMLTVDGDEGSVNLV